MDTPEVVIGGAGAAGIAAARAVLATAVGERWWFAGEATSPTAMGDVHGAWMSGEQAAEAVFKSLRRSRPAGETDVH